MTSIVGPTTYNYNNTTTNATTATTNNVDVTATISVASDLLVVLPLSVLGIVGNLITFVVLKRQRPRLTSSVILRAVVLTDTLLLAGAFITSSQNIARLCLFARNHGNREDGAAEGYEPIFAFVDDLVIRPAMLLLKLLDMWLTVLLTIDRFLLVRRPSMSSHQLYTGASNTHRLVAIVTVLCILVALPRCFERPMTADHGIFRVFLAAYRGTLLLLLYLIPMALLIAFNAYLLASIRRAAQQRLQFAMQELVAQQASSSSGFGATESHNHDGGARIGSRNKEAGLKHDSSNNRGFKEYDKDKCEDFARGGRDFGGACADRPRNYYGGEAKDFLNNGVTDFGGGVDGRVRDFENGVGGRGFRNFGGAAGGGVNGCIGEGVESRVKKSELSTSKGKGSKFRPSHSNSVTLTIVVLVTLSIVGNVCSLLSHVVFIHNNSNAPRHQVARTVTDNVFIVIAVLASSSNFIVCRVCSPLFNHTLATTCCCHLKCSCCIGKQAAQNKYLRNGAEGADHVKLRK